MRNRLSDRLGNGFGYKSGRRYGKRTAALALAMCMSVSLAGCGGKVKINDGTFRPVDEAELEFPLKEKTTLTGMISYRQIRNQSRITGRSLNACRKRLM